VHVLQMIDSLRVGGAQMLLVHFAREARLRNVQTTVLSLYRGVTTTVVDELHALDVPIVWFTARKLFAPRRIIDITHFLRQGKFDVIHTHLSYANILGTLTGRLSGIPVVGTLHSAGIDEHPAQAVRDRIEIWAMRYGMRSVIAVGPTVASVHGERLRGRPIEVIPNAVANAVQLTAEERSALRRQLTGDPQRPLVIAVGRLTPAKGYGDLITAFAGLHARQPEARLVIVGDGTECEALTQQIMAMGMQETILLAGTRNDVPRLLAASDLFVSSSHWEGLPLAILEAMMAGLPIIATAVGDIPNVILPDSGIVVPPHQPQTLASCIEELLVDEARRRSLGEAARANAIHKYSVHAWGERVFGLYGSCCGAESQSLRNP